MFSLPLALPWIQCRTSLLFVGCVTLLLQLTLQGERHVPLQAYVKKNIHSAGLIQKTEDTKGVRLDVPQDTPCSSLYVMRRSFDVGV